MAKIPEELKRNLIENDNLNKARESLRSIIGDEGLDQFSALDSQSQELIIQKVLDFSEISNVLTNKASRDKFIEYIKGFEALKKFGENFADKNFPPAFHGADYIPEFRPPLTKKTYKN